MTTEPSTSDGVTLRFTDSREFTFQRRQPIDYAPVFALRATRRHGGAGRRGEGGVSFGRPISRATQFTCSFFPIVTFDIITQDGIVLGVIQSFRCDETRKVFDGHFSPKLPTNIQKVAHRKLLQLNIAESPEDLRIPPANHFEALRGNRKGQYSIRVNQQWRVCFRWKPDGAHQVEIVDYH